MIGYDEADDVLYGLSAVLDESARFTSPEILEQRVLGALSHLTPAEAESFASTLGDVGRFLKSSEVRGVAATALPIVGTAVGTLYGGPVGAGIGASLGGAAGQAIAGKPPTGATQHPRPATPPVSATTPVSTAEIGQGPEPQPLAQAPQAQPPSGGSAAAAQLLSVIQNPALLSSLLALILGTSGKTSVPVGSNGTDVPVGAMMNLVGELAKRAAEDAESVLAIQQDGTPAYLFDESGCLTCDPAIPSQRADALLRVLSQGDTRDFEEGGPCGCSQCSQGWESDDWW